LILYNIQNEIIVHTAYIKNQIVKYFRINPAKIHIIHHGVYHKEIDNKVTKTHARKTLGLLPTSTVILFFGKIVAYKGFDTLVKSMDLLPKHNRFEVLVAGKISPEYKSEFEVLLKNKIFNNYTLILRYISEQEVELCFRAADITVLPYKEASQSGVLFMSYTYGVPVIVPDIGGFPEDVLVKRTGYVFEADNPKSLAASLLSFEEDWPKSDPSRNTFIKEFAAQNYSWIKSCEKIREVYQAALNKQSSTDYQ